MGTKLENRLNGVRSKSIVKDVRRLGCWVGIELVNPRTGESLARGLRGHYAIAKEVVQCLLEMGCAAARMSEGILHVAPPFTTTDDEIDFIAETVDKVLHRMENVIAQLPAK